MKFVAIAFLVALVVLAGCARPVPQAAPTTPAAEPVSTVETVTVVQDDLAEIDTLTQDLDISEIESLDEDLAALG